MDIFLNYVNVCETGRRDLKNFFTEINCPELGTL